MRWRPLLIRLQWVKQRKAKLLLRAKLSAAEAEKAVYEQHRNGSKVSRVGKRVSVNGMLGRCMKVYATEHHHPLSNHDAKERELLEETIPYPARQIVSSPISGQG